VHHKSRSLLEQLLIILVHKDFAYKVEAISKMQIVFHFILLVLDARVGLHSFNVSHQTLLKFFRSRWPHKDVVALVALLVVA
jgi:hypothetical protein